MYLIFSWLLAATCMADSSGKPERSSSDVTSAHGEGYSGHSDRPQGFLQAKYPTGNQEAAIATQLDDFHKAAANADFDAYFDLFSKDGVFIGTDASERWTVDTFKEFVKPYFSQGKGWTYVPRDRTIVVHGDVAWFDELLDNEAYGECRGSGVLVRENGEWKIAQYNLHFPIPNDLAKQITQMIKAHAQKGR
ncbi:nuclear transport factor 2 family protein [Microbulbifer pacificus]|uniref:Nuclear transport factor 2 family protein n=1 Tax=Microbulbifer pacificus TaxID=407164 RepID=A0AAU0N122_9GAMM|nr:nuclear transport factor 2 family protein [Microbulbifer pacificus]WOX05759.1 nuclear transport factor 2 family protein [Microbulbifer pacificus]